MQESRHKGNEGRCKNVFLVIIVQLFIASNHVGATRERYVSSVFARSEITTASKLKK